MPLTAGHVADLVSAHNLSRCVHERDHRLSSPISHGSDPVAVAGDYRSRVVCRTVVDDDFAKRMVLTESAIDCRRREAFFIVVDDYDANTLRLAHSANLLA